MIKRSEEVEGVAETCVSVSSNDTVHIPSSFTGHMCDVCVCVFCVCLFVCICACMIICERICVRACVCLMYSLHTPTFTSVKHTLPFVKEKPSRRKFDFGRQSPILCSTLNAISYQTEFEKEKRDGRIMSAGRVSKTNGVECEKVWD